jgi:uncharacterized damage-inducible protein DinB
LDFCASLSDDQVKATAVGTFGSIRATLVHIVGAEVDYVNRATGKLPAVPLPSDHFPGFEVLDEHEGNGRISGIQSGVGAGEDN